MFDSKVKLLKDKFIDTFAVTAFILSITFVIICVLAGAFKKLAVSIVKEIKMVQSETK